MDDSFRQFEDWDEYFINEAYMAARKSKDTSTQVGAVIVGPDREIRSKGYNGPCRGACDDDPNIYKKPLKDFLFEHAERNAIYNAARAGIRTSGCTMYCTWEPCASCARAIIQSGISEIVCHAEYPGSPGWSETMEIASQMFSASGVKKRFWTGKPIIDAVRCGGKIHKF